MKKILYILAAAAVVSSLAACGDKDVNTEEKGEETQAENTAASNIVYSTNDFAIYTTDDDLLASKFLTMVGVDVSTINYTDEAAKRVSEFVETDTSTVTEGDPENPGETITKDIVTYFSYKGSRDAVTNVKGITTTGLDTDDNDKCSPVEDVISSYGIDTENEEYIENEVEGTGTYTIRLNFSAEEDDGSVERIVTPKGENPGTTEGKYSIRFTIRNDHVHGISCGMNY